MKHSSEKVVVDEELSLLGEDEVFCGRKKSIYESYKDKASMFVGSVAESNFEGEDYFGKKVLVDSISPHAIFICGMRGSGKSYTLGVLAEEIALKNDAVGTIIIDPMGIFWSMKKENSIEIERKILKKWNLKPHGIKNIVVFCPLGHTKKAPRETWDRIFTIKPSELTAEDWCLTFGFDRFDTLGLLVDRVCEKVRKGYTSSFGKFIEGRGEEYSIQDMIECISSEEGIISKTKGFKESTRRALIARLKGAIDWGIFDVSGTELMDLSKRGQISVIDVSFLEDNVRALIVGVIARKILSTRKMESRREAAGGITDIFGGVPVTWLLIDEAHILVPGGGRKTAATEALIEYVRQGRQPGCSIVLATQQPSAIDSRILSQMDILFCHKLVYEDDVKAVIRRMPSEMPPMFKNEKFIKNLPIGMTILGDKQEETSRSFLVRIRPRLSQHEGRERQPILDIDPELMKQNVKKLILEKYKRCGRAELEEIVSVVREEYGLEFTLDELLEELREEGKLEDMEKKISMIKEEVQEEPEKIMPLESLRSQEILIEIEPERRERSTVEKELKELRFRKEKVISSKIDEKIRKIAERNSKRFMLFSKREIDSIYKIHYPFWKLYFDYYPSKGKYQSLCVFVDGITGEFLLKGGERTRGIRDLITLTYDQRTLMLYLFERESATQIDFVKDLVFDRRKVRRILNSLMRKGLIRIKKQGKFEVVQPNIQYNIIANPKEKKLNFEFSLSQEFVDSDFVIKYILSEDKARRTLDIFKRVSVFDSELIYYPYFLVFYDSSHEVFDGITGKKARQIKEMLKFRV